MKGAIVCLLLLSCIPLLCEGLIWTGVVQKRNAADLAAFRRQQRASPLFSEDFFVNYPDETLLVNITMRSADKKSKTIYTVSLETATDWLYFFNTSIVNRTFVTPLNQEFDGRYEDYNVTGDRYFALFEYKNLDLLTTLENQTFAIVDPLVDVTNQSLVPFAGVIGLGWKPKSSTANCEPTVPPVDYKEPVRKIMDADKGEKNFYVLHVNSATRATDDHTFAISFGEPLPQCGKGSGYTFVAYDGAGDNGFISLQMDGFSYGKEGIAPGGTQATIDAGSPIIATTIPAWKQLVLKIDLEYNYDLRINTVDCSQVGVLEDLVFQIGSKDYNVPATHYVADIGIGDGTCALLLDQVPDGFTYSQWILGQPFLWSYCAYFDVDTDQIGFAYKQ